MDTIDDWVEPEAVEFDCPGCGRLIVAICSYKMSHRICGACLSHPGWHYDSEMRRALDPFDDRDMDKVTMTPVEVECRAVWLHALLASLRRGVRIVEDTRNDTAALEQLWHAKPVLH